MDILKTFGACNKNDTRIHHYFQNNVKPVSTSSKLLLENLVENYLHTVVIASSEKFPNLFAHFKIILNKISGKFIFLSQFYINFRKYDSNLRWRKKTNADGVQMFYKANTRYLNPRNKYLDWEKEQSSSWCCSCLDV